VAYTLQIVAQKGSNPTVVSILFSLEAVFATVSGMLLLNENMSGREWIGCALMLAAVVLAQIPVNQKRKLRLKNETDS
jgi:drug/metabolite transporter (DMT)-like permease